MWQWFKWHCLYNKILYRDAVWRLFWFVLLTKQNKCYFLCLPSALIFFNGSTVSFQRNTSLESKISPHNKWDICGLGIFKFFRKKRIIFEEKNHFSSQTITERKHQINIRTIYLVPIVLVCQLAPNIQLNIRL